MDKTVIIQSTLATISRRENWKKRMCVGISDTLLIKVK
jgi:hypothetical protein